MKRAIQYIGGCIARACMVALVTPFVLVFAAICLLLGLLALGVVYPVFCVLCIFLEDF